MKNGLLVILTQNTFSPLSSVLFFLPSLGHSFAAGGLLALTHDYRLMKEERGWFSLPEILIKMPFTVPLMEIAKYTHVHTQTYLVILRCT